MKYQSNKSAMVTERQINEYIQGQPEPKRTDMKVLHQLLLQLMPNCRVWFSDGKDDKGKVVTNPNIGYGQFTILYKDGSTKEFYQIGISGNTSGISVYIMGLADKKYLPAHFGISIGKATVTGYCIKFKSLKDIHLDRLEEAIRYGIEQTKNSTLSDL